MSNTDRQAFIKLCCEAFDGETLKNVSFSKLEGDASKIKATPKRTQKGRVMQFESFLSEGRVVQKNISRGELEKSLFEALTLSRQTDLATSGGQATLLVSKKGDIKLISKIKSGACKIEAKENDNKKNYVFDGSEEFMKALGISDRNGRVHDKKQGKFRQINRFAEHIGDIMHHLPESGEIKVADLCCGKSYLSFAVYEYLTRVMNREVSMVCVDLKQSVIDYCREIAERLGYKSMNFICGNVAEHESDDRFDLVIPLHACDTATDIVLDRAIASGAKVVLATPCCQKALSAILNSNELSFITKYPHLKMKFAATATDALRAARLEAAGYKVDVFEFTDPEDTPKNTMIRAVRRDVKNMSEFKIRKAKKAYNDAYRFLCGKEPDRLARVTLDTIEGKRRSEMFEKAIKSIYSKDENERLAGAAELEKLFENGYIPAPEFGSWVNNHIHTTYSFSPYTPTAAVYMAKKAGLRTCGIMDHDSVGGAVEFTKAGRTFQIPTTCGCEMRVKVDDGALSGRRLNNPDQLGCAYVALHGIPHQMLDEVERFLVPLRKARNKRNAEMVGRINEIASRLDISITFDDVLALSYFEKGGGVTERHVLFALVNALIRKYPDREECIKAVEALSCAELPESKKNALLTAPEEFYAYDLLGIMKSGLIEKIYISATDELPDIRDFTALANRVGAISAYAYLGDVGQSPTGDKKAQKFEDDYLEELFVKLKDFGFNAVTFMPSRNTATQLDRVMSLCKEHGFFMISGEDINSPRQSFICNAAEDEKFSILKTATWALIGHEALASEDIENAMFKPDGKNASMSLEEKLEYYSGIGKNIENEYFRGKKNG